MRPLETRPCMQKKRDDDGYTASYTSGKKTTESVPRPAGQHRVYDPRQYRSNTAAGYRGGGSRGERCTQGEIRRFPNKTLHIFFCIFTSMFFIGLYFNVVKEKSERA